MRLSGYTEAPCDRETAYFCARIDEFHDDAAAGVTMRLVLDRMSHTKVALLDPRRLSYSYLLAYAEVTSLSAMRKPHLKTLMIGGGGYALPRYLEAVYPESVNHVIELDPGVARLAHERLGLSRDTRIITHIGDARDVLNSWKDAPQFDVVYGDAFNDLSMPYHLATVEFDRIVDRLLADDGVYLANVIDNLESDGDVVRAFVSTFREVFPYVYLLRWGPYEPERIETLVVAGARRPLNLTPFREEARLNEVPGRRFSSTVFADREIDALLGDGRRTILTDDYAPLDQLTAPLFHLRG